jgi:hypothetical protein
MAGEATRAGTALHRLRARWLMPSPPLAVDDEPHWRPAPDSASDEAGDDADAERVPAAPAA